jgi:hypothetical protein
MVGFMDPVGTQFQSAMADLKGRTKAATIASGFIHSVHKLAAAFLRTAFFSIAIKQTGRTKVSEWTVAEGVGVSSVNRKGPGIDRYQAGRIVSGSK